MKIKSTNPRFTKGLELNGNVLSGDTYPAKEHIKKYWEGKWDAQRKVWVVNPEKVMATLKSKYNWGLSISDDEPQDELQVKKNNHTGLCPRCGTYCYGDCTAH